MEPNTYMVAGQTFELKHYGVKGMKWGRRRFQNKDGSLTPAGEKRYNDGDGGSALYPLPHSLAKTCAVVLRKESGAGKT